MGSLPQVSCAVEPGRATNGPDTPGALGAVRSADRAARARLSRWSPEKGDAALYAASAVFALATIALAQNSLYQQWAELAVGPYVGCVLLSLALDRYHAGRARKRETGPGPAAGAVTAGVVTAGAVTAPEIPTVPDQPAPPAGADVTRGLVDAGRHWGAARIWIFLLLLVGATLVPLGLEISWRHAQPEVTVIEKAGNTAAKGKDPYRAVTNRHGHVIVHTPGVPTYENFFPYLPLMTVFGLPSETKGPIRLTDARIFFSVATLLVTAVALGLCRGPNEGKVRTLQVLTVLPTAALPLATGGDDMPVVAFLLLAMVLAQRRRPALAGLVLGVVVSMKFTAWPLAGLALFAAYDKNGKRAPWRMAIGALVVAGPVVVPFIAKGAWAFFENVVLFPLGLAGVKSPAASPLPGHLLVTAFPWLHDKLPLAIGLVGLTVLVVHLIRKPPRSAAQACSLAGWVMLVAIVFAPSTRVGYLLYPVNFFVWAYLLRGADAADVIERAAAASRPGPDLVPGVPAGPG